MKWRRRWHKRRRRALLLCLMDLVERQPWLDVSGTLWDMIR